ncbi:ORF1 [Torque teno equus virus 2]|uniref:Capsid protein n=1 Tax=Torque teno equus virus 2 TaxID=2834153 RepID=A0AAE7RBT6_9VIRU|nr:ORF1 [Torque teno equus virus 2]QUW04985.1 ORF1 [Torque teno equus virus 2]
MAYYWNRNNWRRRRGAWSRRRYYWRRRNYRRWRRRRRVRRQRRRRVARRVFARSGRRGQRYNISGWNPLHMKRLIITALAKFLVVSPGYEYVQYKPISENYKTMTTQGKPIESAIGLSMSGGWTYGEIDIGKLFISNKHYMAKWSTSNKGFDLCRYFGTRITLWPNKEYDYVFWYDREYNTDDWTSVKEYLHPVILFQTPRRIIVRSNKNGRRRPKKVWIKPPAVFGTQWLQTSQICKYGLFMYAISVIDLDTPYTNDAILKHDWFRADFYEGITGQEPEWLERWGHIPPPGHCVYLQSNRKIITWTEEARQGTKEVQKYTLRGELGYGPKFSDGRTYIDYDMAKSKEGTSQQGKTFDWWWNTEKLQQAWEKGIRGVCLRRVLEQDGMDYWNVRLLTTDETRDIWEQKTGDLIQPKKQILNAEWMDLRQRVRMGPMVCKKVLGEDWGMISEEESKCYDIVGKIKCFFQVGGETLPPRQQVDDPCAGTRSSATTSLLSGREIVHPRNSHYGQLQPWMERRGMLTESAIKYLTKETPEREESPFGGRHPGFNRERKRKKTHRTKKKKRYETTSESSEETSSSIESASETEESQMGRNRLHKRRRHNEYELDGDLRRLRIRSKSEGDIPNPLIL